MLNETWTTNTNDYRDDYWRYVDTDITNCKDAYRRFVEMNTKNKLNDHYGIRNAYPKAKKVYYDDVAGVTVVLWTDGDKTVVKVAKGDAHDAYLGYCAALAKKNPRHKQCSQARS